MDNEARGLGYYVHSSLFFLRAAGTLLAIIWATPYHTLYVYALWRFWNVKKWDSKFGPPSLEAAISGVVCVAVDLLLLMWFIFGWSWTSFAILMAARLITLNYSQLPFFRLWGWPFISRRTRTPDQRVS